MKGLGLGMILSLTLRDFCAPSFLQLRIVKVEENKREDDEDCGAGDSFERANTKRILGILGEWERQLELRMKSSCFISYTTSSQLWWSE